MPPGSPDGDQLFRGIVPIDFAIVTACFAAVNAHLLPECERAQRGRRSWVSGARLRRATVGCSAAAALVEQTLRAPKPRSAIDTLVRRGGPDDALRALDVEKLLRQEVRKQRLW